MDLNLLYQLRAHTLGISSLAYNENRRILFSGSLDKTIKIWDFNIIKENSSKEPKLISSIDAHEKWITDIIHIKKYSSVISSSLDKTIKIWDFKHDTLISDLYLDKHLDYVQKLFYLEKSNKLISSGFDCKVYVWDLSNFQISSTIDEYKYPIISISCTEDETTLFLGSYDSKIIFWDLNTNKEKMFLKGQGPIKDLKFLSSQNILVGIDIYGGVFGLDIENVKFLFSKQLKEQLSSLDVIQIGNESFLILGGESNLFIYSITPFREILKIPAHLDKIEAIISIKIDQNITQNLITGSLDRTVKIWEILE